MDLARRCLMFLTAAVAASAAWAAPAPGGFPDRPIKLIVTGGPGSYPDIVGRQLAERLSVDLGQPVNVFNMPGGGGLPAMGALARSDANGYTVGLVTMGHMVFNPHLYRQLPYDPLKDFVPVATILAGPMVVVVHPSAQVTTLQELIGAAKAGKIDVRFAVPGVASPPGIVLQMMMRATGMRVETVPYKTGSEALLNVVAGQPLFYIDAPAVVAPMVRAGRLRAVVVTGSERVSTLPMTPTLAEAGFPGVPGSAWIGVAAPAGTPNEVVSRWNEAIGRAVASPTMQEFLAKDGSRTLRLSPEEFRALIVEDQQRWGKLIREVGLSLD
jgi:tripartite-type tricarboxylate transporter receptor subunit TctC